MYISWINKISKKDIEKVGGKGANLGELTQVRIPVPQGFIVNSDAYKRFLKETGIQKNINKLLSNLDIEDTEKLQETSEKIQDLIIEQNMPQDIQQAITEAYNNMHVDLNILKASKEAVSFIKAGRNLPFVAVRSSATAEDLADTSFAGQMSTFLNIKGSNDVLEAVKRCWASLYTARAIYYRSKNNFPHEKVFIAVIVQRMLNSDKSGVVFTINPTTNNEDEILIEAGYGLGDAIVSGSITPDRYIVDKNSFNIKARKINKQEWYLTKDENLGRTVKKSVPNYLSEKQVLSDDEIKKLAVLVKRIESHYNHPQDIEFATENGMQYIVQTRPVTTTKKEVKEQKEEIKEDQEIILKGLPASQGIATGPVKIIHSIEELNKVQKGDVLVTRMTNPTMTPTMQKASAIITDTGGETSHAAIVSREMGIACIVGTETATQKLKDNQIVTVDAYSGKVYQGKTEVKHEEVKYEQKADTITKIKVNCELPEAAEKAASTNADGVGLARIEFIIAENKIHPLKYIKENKEQEYIDLLVKGLKKICLAFKGKPVWIRTSDLRTDEYKTLEGADQDPEANPMMGLHGIRYSLKNPEILKAEIKAIKELKDQHFNVAVMIPFVIDLEELKKTKQIMKELNIEALKDLPLGIMIETPAAVQIIEELCKDGISFISFGTNDLTQLTLGVDRNNEDIQNLYDETNPAVIKQLQHVINICKKYNVETSICGQSASDPDMAKILVKSGIDSISSNIDSVSKISNIVSEKEKKLLLEASRKQFSA